MAHERRRAGAGPPPCRPMPCDVSRTFRGTFPHVLLFAPRPQRRRTDARTAWRSARRPRASNDPCAALAGTAERTRRGGPPLGGIAYRLSEPGVTVMPGVL